MNNLLWGILGLIGLGVAMTVVGGPIGLAGFIGMVILGLFIL